MKTIALSLLLPLTAFAGSKGALRALEEVQDVVADADAECSKKLGKKLDALASDVEDGASKRKLREQVREVNDFAEDRCPKKLASKVRRALASVAGKDDDEDDERPSRRRSRDDDEEDAAPRRQAPPASGAMDDLSFRGLVSALSANQNEYTKLDLVKNALSNQRLTAQQLGPVLDQFQNEYLKLDAAKAAVPRLVDPQHALVHAGKFRNSFIAADYSKLLAR